MKLRDKLLSALKWRYDNYLAPHVDLYGSLNSWIAHKWTLNKKLRTTSVAYVYANRRNVGDYISFLGIKHLLGLDGAELFCSPAWHNKFVKSIEKIKSDNPQCMLIIGGGGLFQPVFEKFWKVVLESKLKFVVVGVGINKMEGRPLINTTILESVISQASLISVRDHMSTETLGTLDVKTKKTVDMSICPAVSFVHKKEWLQQNDIEQNNILLHMYHPSDLRLAKADFNRIAVSLKEVAKKNDLIYVQHDNMSSNYAEVLGLFKKARIVFSSRLHGCIISHSMGVPFVPMICDDKMKSFVKTHTSRSSYLPAAFENVEEAMRIFNLEINEFKNEKTNIELSINKNVSLFSQIKRLLNEVK